MVRIVRQPIQGMTDPLERPAIRGPLGPDPERLAQTLSGTPYGDLPPDQGTECQLRTDRPLEAGHLVSP
jgi:hypothetical protein